ncbi:MAG TPA: CopG family antitoxin [Pyrinomonadaceae bacterium]|nr:CopG family antitoxin [Pyrinomonadaceae bacterium]
MSENNDIQSSSISQGSSLEEIADYWDTHSLADHWEQTREVDFEVRAPRRITIEPEVYARLEEQARTRGVSLATLVNSWLVEHLSTDKAA